MRLSFGFDEDNRQFILQPKDPLEGLFLAQVSELCSKGASLKLIEILPISTDPLTTENLIQKEYKIEIRINESTLYKKDHK
mgnify:CR=1 FL=1